MLLKVGLARTLARSWFSNITTMYLSNHLPGWPWESAAMAEPTRAKIDVARDNFMVCREANWCLKPWNGAFDEKMRGDVYQKNERRYLCIGVSKIQIAEKIQHPMTAASLRFKLKCASHKIQNTLSDFGELQYLRYYSTLMKMTLQTAIAGNLAWDSNSSVSSVVPTRYKMLFSDFGELQFLR